MRDVVFLVADGEMRRTVEGFFENDAYDKRLQCGRFDFVPKLDLFYHPGKDAGVHADAHKFLSLYQRSHSNAVVMLDFAFNDNLTTKKVNDLQEEIMQNLVGSGWAEECVHVMVINPELEVLMWQEDTQGIEAIIEYPRKTPSLRDWLKDRGLWDEGLPKPSDPKAAIDLIRKQSWGKKKTHSQIFKRVANGVSFKNCQDPAFTGLWAQLQSWYPETYS
jgi:hypothetical protein